MRAPEAVDLDRPRSVGGILGAAAVLYQRYPLLFLILAFGVVAPYELVVLAVSGLGPLARGTHESLAARIPLEVLDFSLVGPLISALHIHAVVVIGEGRRPRLLEVARRGLAVLPVVAAAEIVANLGIIAGFFALVVPGLVLSLRWAVVAQAAAIEKETWPAALRRSAQLVSGGYMRVFSLLLLVGLPTAGLMLGARGIDLGSTSGPASVSLGIVVRTITASFGALTFAILYFDLRARKTEVSTQPARAYEHVRDLD